MDKRTKRMLSAVLISVFIFAYEVQPAFCRPAPKNGVQKEFYAKGKVRLVSKHKDGHLVRRRVYFRNGRLMLDFRYKNGELYSKIIFWENGQLKNKWTKKSGVEEYYSQTGRLKASFKR
ncbi:MAG: hypothetical protein K8S27_16415 [Candidatus Omnitrophica bacterium]|nr:hypothetical protein [Candidatus Omnitrophota bacterium]